MSNVTYAERSNRDHITTTRGFSFGCLSIRTLHRKTCAHGLTHDRNPDVAIHDVQKSLFLTTRPCASRWSRHISLHARPHEDDNVEHA